MRYATILVLPCFQTEVSGQLVTSDMGFLESFCLIGYVWPVLSSFEVTMLIFVCSGIPVIMGQSRYASYIHVCYSYQYQVSPRRNTHLNADWKRRTSFGYCVIRQS